MLTGVTNQHAWTESIGYLEIYLFLAAKQCLVVEWLHSNASRRTGHKTSESRRHRGTAYNPFHSTAMLY